MRKLSRHSRTLLWGLAVLTFGPPLQAASTGNQVPRITAGGAGRNLGDYVSAGTGLNTFYRFFIEVPPTTTNLTIEIFDPDFGLGGLAEEAADRDRQRTGFNSAVTYRLFNPSNTAQTVRFDTGNAAGTGLQLGAAGVNCTTTTPTSGDNNWCLFFTAANPVAGHWRIEMDTSTNGGDDVGAYGLRVHDGTVGAGGRELNVYAESFIQIGVNQVDGAGSRSNLFTMYPYAIRGCTVDANDFDMDADNALTVGGNAQSVTLLNRPATYTTTFGNGALSDNDAWANNVTPTPAAPAANPSGTNLFRNGMGIWTATSRINEVAADNANYSTLYYGDETAATPATGSVPSAQPEAGTFRIYLPTDGGVAPSKPYLWQNVLWNSGPNPPVIGSTSTFTIVVTFVNPTAHDVTFTTAGAPDNVILARIPDDAGADDVNFVVGSLGATQGTPTIAGGNRNITWNPGVVTAGTQVEMAYRVTVLPETATVNVTGAGNATAFGNTLGTRADFYDETGITTSGGAADIAFGGLCPLFVTTTAPVPTPVTLSWLRATRSGGAIDVAWTTDSEHRQVGFDVFGRSGGSWVRLNTQPVPTRRGDSAEPQSYGVRVAAPAGIEEIALDDIAYDGTRTRHPPVRVGGELGTPPAPTYDWSTARAEHATARAARAGAGGTTQAYLDIDGDGIWRVSVADLAAAGIDFASAPTDAVALLAPDGPRPIAIDGAAGGVLGSTATIEFFGQQRKSLYGGANTYLLTVDAGAARRARRALGAASPWPQALDRYYTDSAQARDLAYSFASPASDPWYDTQMLAFAPNGAQFDFVLPVDALVDVEGASVALDLWGASDFPAVENDHRIELLVNGTSIASHDFPGLRRELLRFELPAGVLAPGNNTVRVRMPADQGTSHDLLYLDRVALGYQRGFSAVDGRLDAALGGPGDGAAGDSDLLFRDGVGDTPGACTASECAVVDVQGVSGPMRAYVADDSGLLRLDDVVAAGGVARAIVPLGTSQRLLLAQDAQVGIATVRGVPEPVDALVPADLLLVSHPDFSGSLTSFVSAREAQGLTVRVVETDGIYARYSDGLPDPAAIRQLLSDAYAVGVRYTLLVGGDTYDYDDHLGLGAISFVPTPYTWTNEVVRYAPSDSLLGDVRDADGLPGSDGLPDIAVGRWPVRTQADLAAVLAKTLAYDSASHAARALLVSGGSQPELAFPLLNDDLQATLTPYGWTVDRADIDALGCTPTACAARDAVIAAINGGRALTNFVGHSSVDRWTFDPLLTGTQAESLLGNATAPTVVTQWGCWSSWFVSPSYNSMAHRFLLDADGGAAAVIGASTLVDTPQTDAYVRALYERVADGTQRLGDALDATRRETAADTPHRRDLIYGVNLLGDPTLRIRR